MFVLTVVFGTFPLKTTFFMAFSLAILILCFGAIVPVCVKSEKIENNSKNRKVQPIRTRTRQRVSLF